MSVTFVGVVGAGVEPPVEVPSVVLLQPAARPAATAIAAAAAMTPTCRGNVLEFIRDPSILGHHHDRPSTLLGLWIRHSELPAQLAVRS
jgi:hypothetical protein